MTVSRLQSADEQHSFETGDPGESRQNERIHHHLCYVYDYGVNSYNVREGGE